MAYWTSENTDRWHREIAHAKVLMRDVETGVNEQGRPFICGTYDLMSEHGYLHDSFRLRVQYPSTYPCRGILPDVFLESHRDKWRNGRDSHIEEHWRLCLFVPSESGIRSHDEESLPKLLAAVHTFLLRERIYQRSIDEEVIRGRVPSWPGPQRSHGMLGLMEAVRERGLPGRNSPCPCGSGKKFKRCHWDNLRPR